MPKKKIINPLPSVQEIERKLAHLPPDEAEQRMRLILRIYKMTNTFLQKRFADRLAREDAARIRQIKRGL